LFEHVEDAEFSKGDKYESKNPEDINQFSTKKQKNWERQLNVSNTSRWRYEEEEMQQPVNNNKKFQIMYQQEDRLDMEIEEIRMLMMKVSQRRHTEVRKTINNKVQLILQVFINKYQWKDTKSSMGSWKVAGNNNTTRNSGARGQQQHKVWDIGGLQKWNS
jgi:predicted metal-dependent hydrolase